MRLPTVVVRGDILESWLTISDYSRSRLALELGVSKGRVSQLLTSEEEPSAHLIAKLMTLTHLPFDRLFKVVRTAPVALPPSDPASQIVGTATPSSSSSSARPRRNGRRILVQQ